MLGPVVCEWRGCETEPRTEAMARTVEAQTPTEDTEQTLSLHIMDWKIPFFTMKFKLVKYVHTKFATQSQTGIVVNTRR